MLSRANPALPANQTSSLITDHHAEKTRRRWWGQRLLNLPYGAGGDRKAQNHGQTPPPWWIKAKLIGYNHGRSVEQNANALKARCSIFGVVSSISLASLTRQRAGIRALVLPAVLQTLL